MTLRGAAALVLALAATPAAADFRSAFGQYQRGEFAAARSEFESLAALGDGPSQFNLGVMTLNGQGGPEDRGQGVGWLAAARENGSTEITADKLARLRSKLSPREIAQADRIVATYGKAALMVDVLPRDWSDPEVCADRPPQPDFFARPKTPGSAAARRRSGGVTVGFVIGADGHPRDLDVMGASEMDFELFGPTAEEMALRSRYPSSAATQFPKGRANMFRFNFRVNPEADPHYSESRAHLKDLRERSLRGDTVAQFLLGIETLEGQPDRKAVMAARELILMAAQGGNADAQYYVARQFEIWRPCASARGAAIWLQAAAERGSDAAAARLVDRLLDDEPSAGEIDAAHRWLARIADSANPFAIRRALAHFAASPFPALRDSVAAGRIADRLDRERKPLDPQMREALAAAFAARGDFGKAVARQRDAIEAARDLKWNTTWMDARLACYRAGGAWHGDLLAVPPEPAAPQAAGVCAPSHSPASHAGDAGGTHGDTR